MLMESECQGAFLPPPKHHASAPPFGGKVGGPGRIRPTMPGRAGQPCPAHFTPEGGSPLAAIASPLSSSSQAPRIRTAYRQKNGRGKAAAPNWSSHRHAEKWDERGLPGVASREAWAARPYRATTETPTCHKSPSLSLRRYRRRNTGRAVWCSGRLTCFAVIMEISRFTTSTRAFQRRLKTSAQGHSASCC